MSDRTCSFPGCERPHKAHGLCNPHYQQLRAGKPLRKLRGATLRERFEAQINYNGPINPKTGTRCHLWTGSPEGKGYGQVSVNSRGVQAHRIAWELYVGPIPDGYQIDHDDELVGCSNRLCVNVEHLQPTLTNARRIKTNTSGEWGIGWDKRDQVWRVQLSVSVNGKLKYYTPSVIGLPPRYKGDPPPAKPPQEAIDAREKLRVHLGLPE